MAPRPDRAGTLTQARWRRRTSGSSTSRATRPRGRACHRRPGRDDRRLCRRRDDRDSVRRPVREAVPVGDPLAVGRDGGHAVPGRPGRRRTCAVGTIDVDDEQPTAARRVACRVHAEEDPAPSAEYVAPKVLSISDGTVAGTTGRWFPPSTSMANRPHFPSTRARYASSRPSGGRNRTKSIPSAVAIVLVVPSRTRRPGRAGPRDRSSSRTRPGPLTWWMRAT